MAPNGAGSFFPTNPDLDDILGDTDSDFDIIFLDAFGIPEFRIPGFPDFQIPESWNQVPGYGWLRLGGGTGRTISAVSGRHSRTTEFRRSKELGQGPENPISASPVWGITVQTVQPILLLLPRPWPHL